MFDAARDIVLASFPPGLSEIERKARLIERLYGSEIDVGAFVDSLTASCKKTSEPEELSQVLESGK